MRRHREAHLPRVLALAREAEDEAHGEDLLSRIRSAEAHARRLVDKAEKGRDVRAALAGLKVVLDALALLARVAEEAPRLVRSAEWLELRARIAAALKPHPDAAVDVLRAIEEGGARGA